jgi:hypothetical protein
VRSCRPQAKALREWEAISQHPSYQATSRRQWRTETPWSHLSSASTRFRPPLPARSALQNSSQSNGEVDDSFRERSHVVCHLRSSLTIGFPEGNFSSSTTSHEWTRSIDPPSSACRNVASNFGPKAEMPRCSAPHPTTKLTERTIPDATAAPSLTMHAPQQTRDAANSAIFRCDLLRARAQCEGATPPTDESRCEVR